MITFDDIPEAPTPVAGWKEGETTPPADIPAGSRAKIVSQTEFMKLVTSGADVDERLMFGSHPTRPFLLWMVLPVQPLQTESPQKS